MRRFLLNENEHGFRRAKRPVYYDEGQDGLEVTINYKSSNSDRGVYLVS